VGRSKLRDFARYGKTTVEADDYGLPVRFRWKHWSDFVQKESLRKEPLRKELLRRVHECIFIVLALERVVSTDYWITEFLVSWVTILWPMIASACLTLAGIKVLSLARDSRGLNLSSLLFSLTSVSTADFASCELRMMHE
jgi:hypothetical protein